ncbi:MAG: SDR family NAD(P)-dependent oxidoreductase [Elusimicrobia bacterium]|nr:SDR family NAD(P)-dependent oxidoreductase [Elusimicrobiota bacterium]
MRPPPAWDEGAAAGLEGPALCAYASRLIGSDPELVLAGGGNSSIKTLERDGAGRPTRVLWIKASGYAMRAISAEGFSPLRLDGLLALRSRAALSDEEMVARQKACLLDPKAARPSIETLLHAWVPAPHVYHTHADAVAGFTCAPRSRERTRRAFGEGVLWIPYRRPGFELSKRVAEAVERSPSAWALILDKHGALTWGGTAREACEAMLRLARACRRDVRLPGDRAELGRRPRAPAGLPASERRRRAARLLPWLRGEAGRSRRAIVRWSDDPAVLRLLARPQAPALVRRGTFTMEHALHVRARPLLWRAGSRASLRRAFDRYRRWHAAYFRAHAPPGTPAGDHDPRVVLVPGLGLFALGRDWRLAGVPAEIYRHTARVILRVASFTRYAPLGPGPLGDVEFWPLETSKLALLAPEKRLSRRVAWVEGAAGKAAARARALCEAGAHVVVSDVELARAQAAARRLNARFGAAQALGLGLDPEDEASVRRAVEEAVLTYGGLDLLAPGAGSASPLLASALLRLIEEQGLDGDIDKAWPAG